MLLTNQRGTAIFVAVMMLVLSTGLGFLAFRVSLTELQISSYEKNELAAGYLADSGVEKILSWISIPAESPNAEFFESLRSWRSRCSGEPSLPDFELSSSILADAASGPFSELKEMGRIVDLRLYHGEHPKGICTVEVKAESGKGAVKIVRVELTRGPMQPLTAGIQGAGNPDFPSPIWAHWGKIRYTGDGNLGSSIQKIPMRSTAPPCPSVYTDGGLNQDPWLEIQVQKRIENPIHLPGAPVDVGPGEGDRPFPDRLNVSENVSAVSLDLIDLTELKNYVKKYGNYYLVSPLGHLEQNGLDKGTFDQLFDRPGSDHPLVWIDILPGYSSSEPVTIGGANHKGYFFFTGNIRVEGGQAGRQVSAQSPPWPSSIPQQIALDGINLDGFFYVAGELNLRGPFSVYGAVFAGGGFSGPGAGQLEVWYNHSYRSANYSGLPSIIRLKGTWRYIPVSDKNG